MKELSEKGRRQWKTATERDEETEGGRGREKRRRDEEKCNVMESGINQRAGTGLKENAINVVCRQRKREEVGDK